MCSLFSLFSLLSSHVIASQASTRVISFRESSSTPSSINKNHNLNINNADGITKTKIITQTTSITQAITKQTITHTITSPNEPEPFTTEPYIITTNTNPLNLTISGTHIHMEENIKFLGVMVHENVKWHHHVNKIIKKISK
eukprot:Lithocolla_globosa_v1_NODE_9387_length_711_cov_86.867580.p1 type:complete len:141 gc:universal NODE_9387_length_711_cov_86.867580:79-501(+)